MDFNEQENRYMSPQTAGPAPINAIKDCLTDISLALEYRKINILVNELLVLTTLCNLVHANNICHRDIKPEVRVMYLLIECVMLMVLRERRMFLSLRTITLNWETLVLRTCSMMIYSKTKN